MEQGLVSRTTVLVPTAFKLFLSVASSDVCSRIRAVMTTSTWISLIGKLEQGRAGPHI